MWFRIKKKSRIEVGYGLEGDFPDALVYMMQQNYFNPYARKGDYAGGVAAIIEAVDNRLGNVDFAKPESLSNNENEQISLKTFFFFYVGFMSLITIWMILYLFNNTKVGSNSHNTAVVAYDYLRHNSRMIPLVMLVLFLPGGFCFGYYIKID
ncbi:TPM domain-containing protein [Porphyromonas macacae]|uniref:TPM domain-containing protein n=1 Tax=Porphyromonas macacae TaxID=28115 RepID=UPI000469D081|nr:TPM domain-containing protein [Porphyromonas macacae]